MPIQRSDSAGVIVVDFGRLPARSSSQLALSSSPELVLGSGGTTSRSEFFGITGVVRLSDGRIVVADGGSGTLRYFTPDGLPEGSVAGLGEGPAEFESLSFLARLEGDSLLTADASLSRVQVFDPEGRFVGGWSLRGEGAAPWSPEPVGVSPPGHLVALQRSPPGPSDGRDPQRDPVALLLLDRSGARDTITVLRGPEQLTRRTERGFSMEAVTFGANSDVASGGGIIAVVDTDQFGFRVFEGGALAAVVAVSRPRVPVSPDALEAFASESLSTWPPGASDEARERFRQRVLTGPHAAYLPQVASVEVDALARVWVNVARPSGVEGETFEVFDRRGQWIAEVAFPPGLDRGTNGANGPGMDIGPDYVLGVWRDELGVESVRMYSIVDPTLE